MNISVTTTTDPVSDNSNGPTVTSPIVVGGAAPEVESPIVLDNPPAPAPEAEVEVAPVAEPDASKPTTPEWAQKRINELTAKRYEAERTSTQEKEARIAAERRLAEALARTTTPEAKPIEAKAPMDEEEIERRALEKATLMAQAAKFNETCNVVADTGKKEFKDWDDALKNLSLVGAIGKDSSPDFLETAVELSSPHKVLHYLGTNMEEAERITKLSPKKMALEMARLESKLNAPAPAPAPAPVSSAPAPVIPIAGAAKVGPADVGDSDASMDAWMQARQKQIAERQNRYRRV